MLRFELNEIEHFYPSYDQLKKKTTQKRNKTITIKFMDRTRRETYQENANLTQ